MSCSGLDTLPHNGAVVTLLLICGLSHRQSYLDIFVVSVVAPIVATALVLLVGSTVGCM
jgi:H+/gluconate symporter-like permease